MPKRPNVLWIYCDELRLDAVSAYGNRWARIATPNIDAIAARGLKFNRYHVNSPVCVSSRYASKTGRYPIATGVLHNDAMFFAESFFATGSGGDVPPSFTSAFAAAGYRTATYGKSHTPKVLQPFDEYVGDGSDQMGLMALVGKLDPDQVGLVRATYGGTLAGTWPEAVPYPPEHVTSNVVGFLDAVDDTPFVCRASYLQPHTPVVVPEPWASRYDDEPWPDAPVDPVDGLSVFERRFGEQCGFGRLAPEQQVAAQSRYHGLVAWIDDQIGQLLTALDRNGLTDSTVVVFTSDHGTQLGELGGGIGKQTFNPASQRVPFLLAGPGVPAGERTDLAESIDMAPTLLELADLELSTPLDGRSMLTSAPADHATYATIGYGNTGARAFSLVGFCSYVDERGWPQRSGVRQGRWRLDRNVRLDGQPAQPADVDTFLCDTEADPLELTNVARDPANAEVAQRLHGLLDHHLERAAVHTDSQLADARETRDTLVRAHLEARAMEGGA